MTGMKSPQKQSSAYFQALCWASGIEVQAKMLEIETTLLKVRMFPFLGCRSFSICRMEAKLTKRWDLLNMIYYHDLVRLLATELGRFKRAQP